MTNPKRYTQPVVQAQQGPEFKVAEVPLFEDPKGKWVRYDDIKHLLAPELPESLRDPVKNLERGRELLSKWPCWCPYCNQPHGVNQTPVTDASLATSYVDKIVR